MGKIQEIKRVNGTTVYFTYFSKEAFENSEFKKGDEVSFKSRKGLILVSKK